MVAQGVRVGLLVVVVTSLAAASLWAAFILQDHAAQVAPEGDAGIGVVGFEPSHRDAPEARDGKLVLVTRRRGSYAEANAAMALATQAYCQDGRGVSLSGLEPDAVIGPEDWEKPNFPAGSRFAQDIGCDGPLPNEMPIAPDTPESVAEARVRGALTDLGAGASDQLTVSTVPYSEIQPKYGAFDRALGAILRGFASDHCSDGQVVVDAVAVGTYPPPRPAKTTAIVHSRIMLGTALSCLRRDAGKG